MDGSVIKNLPANARDAGLIPGSGRSPGVGNGNPLQYSCLDNCQDRGAWRATVRGLTDRHDWTLCPTKAHKLYCPKSEFEDASLLLFLLNEMSQIARPCTVMRWHLPYKNTSSSSLPPHSVISLAEVSLTSQWQLFEGQVNCENL